MKNSYGSLVEEWKVDLIVARAKLKGLSDDDIEDVQQDIIPSVARFRFDRERSHGATETTVLTALIDKQLTHFQRGRARRRKQNRKYRKMHRLRGGRKLIERPEPDHAYQWSMTSDVRHVIAELDPVARKVCAGIMRGESRAQIARRLGISRYEADKAVAQIRELFEARNLGEWIQEC